MGKIRHTTEKVSFFRVHVLLSTKEEFTAERRRWISAISREDLTDSILENEIATSILCQENLLKTGIVLTWIGCLLCVLGILNNKCK